MDRLHDISNSGRVIGSLLFETLLLFFHIFTNITLYTYRRDDAFYFLSVSNLFLFTTIDTREINKLNLKIYHYHYNILYHNILYHSKS